MTRIDWQDLNFTVVMELHSHHASFTLYDVIGWQDDKTPIWSEDPDCPQSTTDLSKAVVYLRGSVKWDGCSNWFFEAQRDDAMLHACDRHELLRFSQAMARCWDLTAENLETWDR